jgi:hypothetical protein
MAGRNLLAAFGVGALAVAAAGFALESGTAPSPGAVSTDPSDLSVAPLTAVKRGAEPFDEGLAQVSLPPSGRFRLTDDGHRLGLVSNRASRKAILRALGEARDLVVTDHSLGDPTIQVSIADSSLEQVLAVLMAETPYQLDYTLDTDRGVARPARLSIASDEPGDSDDSDTSSQAILAVRTNPAGRPKPVRSPEKEQRRQLRDSQRQALVALQARPSSSYRRATLKARAMREERRRDALLERLEEAEPQDVVNELWKLDPEDPSAVAFLVSRLQSSNVGVRVAAARQLEFARDSDSGQALRAALDDPHPYVVKTAIDSLRAQGSRVALRELAELRGHADPDVRASARLAFAKLR